MSKTMIPNHESVAAAVKAELDRHDMSIADLARELDVHYQMLYRRVAGDVPFSAIELATIAEVLDTHVEAFLPAPAEVSS